MKPLAVKNNPRPLWDMTQEIAPGFIRLVKRGKPVAYVLLASHYDEEDIGYMTDPAFWESIGVRRAGDVGIPWEDVKAELVERERAEAAEAVKPRSNGRKKGKRNGTA